MSRVPYTINVDEYVCSALEQIRTMIKTLDFSGLLATVERIQFHASKMEEALYSYSGIKYKINDLLKDPEVSDADFKKKVSEIMENVNKNTGD